MMRFIILNILLFISVVVFSQNPNQNRPQVHVTGIILEEGTNYPLEYATIILTPENGQVQGGISDANGKFDITIPAGNYKVTVEFISYKTIDLGTKKIAQNLNLGTIYLHSEVETLGEVEIIAEKSTVEVKLDKKIYNVGKDMTVKGGTAADVLDNVPSVAVDVEGNVSLRGNESVRILIDGKPSGLVGLSATDALRQLPSDAIQKVEVITSPSARYDAEGTAGIINIVLRKGSVTGFNASVSLNTGIPDNHGISVNVNNRNKYFNLFSNLGYNYRKFSGNALYYNFVGTESNKLNEETIETDRTRKGFNGNIGLEFFLGAKASVTGSILYRKSPNTSYAISERNVFKTNPEQYFRWQDQNEEDQVLEYALNFTQKFNKDDHKWTIDIKFEDDKEVENDYITESLNETGIVPSEKNLRDDNQKTWLIKSDYVLPLGEKQQFEAGFQADLEASSANYAVNDYENGNFVLNTNVSNLLKSNRNIYAGYFQYGTKWNKLSALLGLRMEHTYIFLNGQETTEYPNIDIDKKYTNFFPTLNFTYELKENENITVGLNRRIRRPNDRQLNPFESRTSETNVFKGNPDLDPVISTTADVGYYKKWNKFSLNTSVYYQYANNAIQMVRIVTPEIINGTNKIMATPINLNSESRIGSELTLTYSPLKMLQLSNTFNFYNYKSVGIYENIDYGANDYSWNNRFAAKAKLTKKSDFQFTMTYEGPYQNNFLKREAILVLNAAYSMDVLKDKGTISFNVSDLLNTRYRQVYNYDTAFNSYAKMQWMPRQFNLNFTYRFNQTKKQNKQQPVREENGGDDMI